MAGQDKPKVLKRSVRLLMTMIMTIMKNIIKTHKK